MKFDIKNFRYHRELPHDILGRSYVLYIQIVGSVILSEVYFFETVEKIFHE